MQTRKSFLGLQYSKHGSWLKHASMTRGYLHILVSLQGKDLLAEVIMKVSSVTKLAKFVKKTSTTTFIYKVQASMHTYMYHISFVHLMSSTGEVKYLSTGDFVL
jgi:hypothetical protein